MRQTQKSPPSQLMYDSNENVQRFSHVERSRNLTFGGEPNANNYASKSNDDNNSQYRPPKLKHLQSIHKQDEGLPGNFYYLRSNENIQDESSQEQLIKDIEEEK